MILLSLLASACAGWAAGGFLFRNDKAFPRADVLVAVLCFLGLNIVACTGAATAEKLGKEVAAIRQEVGDVRNDIDDRCRKQTVLEWFDVIRGRIQNIEERHMELSAAVVELRTGVGEAE